jgi:glycosyltransferase involved in cell wall biosynthesis
MRMKQGSNHLSIALNGRFLLQPITGVQRVAREVTAAMDRLVAAGTFGNVRLRVLLPAEGAIVGDFPLTSAVLERKGSLKGHAWEQLQLPAMIGDDILLCLGNTAPIASLYQKGVRVAVIVHDLSYRYFPAAYDWRFKALYNRIMPAVLRRAGLVITVSESERRAILGSYPKVKSLESRLVAVQNGGASENAGRKQIKTYAERQNLCLYVGSLTERKNASGLFAACNELLAAPNTQCVFIGSTGKSFSADEQRFNDLSAHPNVRMLGQIDDFDVIEQYLQTAKVLLFPSFYESSGLPTTEAMTYGCPVVASSIPSLLERCGDAAVYCDPRSTTSIVEAAKSLLYSEEIWTDYSRRGLTRARLFSWEAQASKILEHLIELRFDGDVERLAS